MNYQNYIKITLLFLWLISCSAYGQKKLSYDMEKIKDFSLLELKVLQEWHQVETTPPTQQKIVEITLCNFENGRKVRIPVTYVVPKTNQPCHFIVSGGDLAPSIVKEFDGLMTKMLENNIGFVLPAIGPIPKMIPDGPQLNEELKQLFKKTRNIKHTQWWLWGVTYMRAITAALSEKEKFSNKKIATDGRSKTGLAGAIALNHYPEVTGLYARVIPSSISPHFFTKKYKEKVEQENKDFNQRLAIGEITKLGTIDDDAYDAMLNKAKNYVAKEKYPKINIHRLYDKEIREMFMITENFDVLKKKNAQYYLFVGTNDNITLDVPYLAEKYPDYPITYFPEGRHGGLSRFLGISGTPDSEEAKTNRIAFFSQFYLGKKTILEKPDIQYQYQDNNRTLAVKVTFSKDVPEKVRLHYAYNRYSPASSGYEYDIWEQQSMKKIDNNSWQLSIIVPEHVKTVSMLSFQEGNKGMPTNSSSNYITVQTK